MRILARLLRAKAPPRAQAGLPGLGTAAGALSCRREQCVAHAGAAVSWFRRGGRSARTSQAELERAGTQSATSSAPEARAEAGPDARPRSAPQAGAMRSGSQGPSAGSDTGLGSGLEDGRGGSAVLQRDLAGVLASNGALRARALDRLFVMLNWALTELAAASRVRMPCMASQYQGIMHRASLLCVRCKARLYYDGRLLCPSMKSWMEFPASISSSC